MVSGMTLFVRTPQGKTLTLDVDPFDTIGDVKAKIQHVEAIPMDYQRLSMLGTPLSDNDKTLKGYKVKPNSTLDLSDANPIYFTTPSGRTLTLDVDQ
jgi:ubiquitin C